MCDGVWIWGLLGLCVALLAALGCKIMVMRCTAREIREKISYRLQEDTNTPIDIASRDSAMRALADGLNEELRTLRRQRLQYEQGSLALQEAVTNISHDIRTPLTAIRGYLELLAREDNKENIKRYLNIITERCETLSQLTEELFRYTVAVSAEPQTARGKAAADSGEGAGAEHGSETAVTDIRRLLEESVLAAYGTLALRGIEPVVQMPDEKVKCRINERITRRIFENILNNALKYSDGDLQITLDRQGRVTFANHAAALDEVQVGRLFDRFYTVENAKTATGLGLAIAKQLTEQTGGSINAWYESGMLYLRLCFPTA